MKYYYKNTGVIVESDKELDSMFFTKVEPSKAPKTPKKPTEKKKTKK